MILEAARTLFALYDKLHEHSSQTIIDVRN